LRTLHDVICASEFVLFNNAVIFVILFDLQYDMGRRNKRQSNSSYTFAKRQCVLLDVYGMSFVINTGIWLVSLDCLNTWTIDEICSIKCGIRIICPRSGPSACNYRTC